MKRLVLNTFPYVLIIVCYGLVGEYILYENKESYSIDQVTTLQQELETETYYCREILGNALSNYKFQMLKKKQPTGVMVLGQSVTLQFRDFMFEPYQDEFYNTGLMARNVTDLNYVMDLIDQGDLNKPKLILLGVDISFFLEYTMLDSVEWTRNHPEDRAVSSKSHLKGIQRIFLNSEYRSIPATNYGFGRAGMGGRGYRNDGSYRHKPDIERYLRDSTYNDGALITYLQNRTAPFIEPFRFSEQKKLQYFEFLERVKAMDIELVLYVPPYSDVYFNQAIQDTMFNTYWNQFMEVQQELTTLGFNVIPFTTPSKMGLTDHYMVDAEHPGEVMCAMQLQQAIQQKQLQGNIIQSLTFSTVNEYGRSEYMIPISFMSDPIDQLLVKQTQKKV
jgi:hypothetical protein